MQDLHQHIFRNYNLIDKSKYFTFFVDDQGDKINITRSRDLKNAIKLALRSDETNITVYIWRNDRHKPLINPVAKTNGWNLPLFLNMKDNMIVPEQSLKPIITRNLHKYHLHCRYKDHVYYKCENSKNLD